MTDVQDFLKKAQPYQKQPTPLFPTPSKSKAIIVRHASPSFTTLPFLTATSTKSEQYERFTKFDKRTRRSRAHCRNALKTTETLEHISRRLNEHLESPVTNKLSLQRLAAHAETFEDLIRISGPFSPLLQRIKDAYENHLKAVLSKHKVTNLSQLQPPPSLNRDELQPSDELFRLRKKLHALEVKCKVLLQENERLRRELSREVEVHERVLEELRTPVYEEQDERPSSPGDYSTRVEEIQLQISKERESLLEVLSQRSGRVPLSVCHQLEQCLRETEIETQKQQKRNITLRQQVQEAESGLVKILNSMNTSTDIVSKLWKGLEADHTGNDENRLRHSN